MRVNRLGPAWLVAVVFTVAGCGFEPCQELLDPLIFEPLPIEGCRRVAQTVVTSTLTVAPGTRLEFEPGGYIEVRGGTLISVAEDGQPSIVFTSNGPSPEPGSWRYVRIASDSPNTRFVGTTFEFGGTPREPESPGPTAMLVVDGKIGEIRDSRFLLSAAGAIDFGPGAQVNARVTGTLFEANNAPSIEIGLDDMLSLGPGNRFADDGDYIAVETKRALGYSDADRPAEWEAQDVPYRLLRNSTTDPPVLNAEVFSTVDQPLVIKPGTTIQLEGGSLDIRGFAVQIGGSPGSPVTFTSAGGEPDSWGCLRVRAVRPEPESYISYAVIEGAGNGTQCPPSSILSYLTALEAHADVRVDHTEFRALAPGTEASIVTAAPCEGEFAPTGFCGEGNVFPDGPAHIKCANSTPSSRLSFCRER